jgi:predicted metalloprotease with PDZ domain
MVGRLRKEMRGVIAIMIVAVFATADSATAEAIRYALAPVIDNGTLKAVSIEMVLAGEPDGETEFVLPDAWGGKEDLWQGIGAFRVSGEGMSAVAGPDPSRKIVRHAPNATLTVRYRVAQFWAGEPTANGENEYRPVVRPTYFHLIGHTAFARPDWSLATPVSVVWRDFPAAWRLASDLEHRRAGTPLNLAALMESISVGGDFRLLSAGALRIAIRGTWPFSDRDLATRIEPIIASHHAFWGDAREPFLVTVLPLQAAPGSSSLGGTALGDAFAFFASVNVEDRQLTRVLAHEHLHNWIPRRIGSMPEVDDIADYWLSEGFADFYTYRLLVRDGALTVDAFAKASNDVLWAYGFSHARNAPNAQVIERFWSDREVGQLPYQRGFLLATLADHLVGVATKGRYDLDDVMFGMKADASVGGDRPPPARQLFIANMKKFGVDVSGDIERLIEKGETVVLPENIWGRCGALSTSEIAEFDRGFDGRRTMANGNVVTGVDPDGPAYAAGLRDGMQLLRLDLGERGDSRLPLVHRIAAQGNVREIRYLPAGKRRMAVQEFLLSGGLDDAGRKACAARLAGTD